MAVPRMLWGTYFQYERDGEPGPGRPRVWEVQDRAQQRWFVKQHAGPKGHRREVQAYQEWTHLLGAGRAPELVAADPVAQAIVITPLPGTSVHNHPLEARQELEAYQQAGYLLAQLHTAPVPDLPSESEEAWRAGMEKMLGDAVVYLPADVVAMLRNITAERPDPLPAAVCHADFQPRSWLWDTATRTLRLIDFERTCIEPPACRDLARLELRILPAKAKLRAAFYDGYGRQPDAVELNACYAYGALDAVSLLKWGLEHQDIESVDQAHAMLENLRLAHTRRIWRA